MTVKIIETAREKIAVVNSDIPIITDGQSALDFAVTIGYDYECQRIVLNKAAVAEDFFRLAGGIAGEVIQKFVNYGFCLAIVGDFSGYTSKPLRDFIYESNHGTQLFFVADEETAVKKLGGESSE